MISSSWVGLVSGQDALLKVDADGFGSDLVACCQHSCIARSENSALEIYFDIMECVEVDVVARFSARPSENA